LDQALERILNIAQLIPIDLKTIGDAVALQQSRSLSPPDSIVYASVLGHLEGAGDGPHCFITQNSKDFMNPDIQSDLDASDCKLLTNFRNGLGYIRSRLKKASP
jgi:hypothetical protein